MPALEVAILAVLTASMIAWLAFLTRQILELTRTQATTAENLRNVVLLLSHTTEKLALIASDQAHANEDLAVQRYLAQRKAAV